MTASTKSASTFATLKSLYQRFKTPSELSRKGQKKGNAQLGYKASSKAPSVASDDTFWSPPASSVASKTRYAPKAVASTLTSAKLQAPAFAKTSTKDRISSWLSAQADSTVEPAGAHAAAVTAAKTPGVWGGELELVALSKLLGRSIRIFSRIGSSPRFSGAIVNVQLGRTMNADAGRPIDLLFDGTHYDSLTGAHDRKNGTFGAVLNKVPGDGDCLMHAVAHAADLPMSRLVAGMHSSDQLWLIRQHNTTFRAMFDDIDSLTDDQVLSQFRTMVVAQLRHDVSRELAKPEYAEAAALAAKAYSQK